MEPRYPGAAPEPKLMLLDFLEARRQSVLGSDRGALGGWFTVPEESPPLGWVLLHVLGEYATHQGHLDIVAEIVADAAT